MKRSLLLGQGRSYHLHSARRSTKGGGCFRTWPTKIKPEKGNTIEVAENAQVAKGAAQAGELFDRPTLGGICAGEINDIVDRAARKLAQEKKPAAEIRADAYERVRSSISGAIEKGEGRGLDVVQEPGPSDESASRIIDKSLPGDQFLSGSEGTLDEDSLGDASGKRPGKAPAAPGSGEGFGDTPQLNSQQVVALLKDSKTQG